MFVRDPVDLSEITAGDRSLLKELLNPLCDPIAVRYSLALARLEPGMATRRHRLRSAEVYYILEGEGEMTIEGETRRVRTSQAVYVPPGSLQHIRNVGDGELKFLCIVDPAWKKEDEEII